jgi:hypothetical protein
VRPPDDLGFGITVYACPLPECLWTMREQVTADVALRVDRATVATAMVPGPHQNAARALVDAAISQASRERGEALEREVRAHLETHDVLDFLRAIRLLEQQLYQQDSGIRPHAHRAPRGSSHDPEQDPYCDGYGERCR